MKKPFKGLYTFDGKPIPIRQLSIYAEIIDTAARITFIQQFRNLENIPIEAVYCFPVEDSAAINRLEIKIGKRTLSGMVEVREKARKLYKRYLKKGHHPFLLDMEARDILALSVGNLPPGESAVVELGYIVRLPVIGGIMRMQLPLTISPRYSVDASRRDSPDRDRITPSFSDLPPYKLDLRITGNLSGVNKIESPSHMVKIEYKHDRFLVVMAESGFALDRDFILEFELARPNELVSFAGSWNGETAAMLRFFPEFKAEPDSDDAKSDLLFMVDCSGSMAKKSISQAKETLELCLRCLNPGDYFNLIRFGTDFHVYRPAPILYNEKNLETALRDFSGIDADLGGTELREAIACACGLPVRKNCRRDIILLTDGEVHNTGEIVNYVAENHRAIRFYTFGIGFAASHHLVKGLARVSGGAWEMVQPGEHIREKVLRQLARIKQPVVDKFEIRMENTGFELNHPSPSFSIYNGDCFTAFARITSLHENSEAVLIWEVKGEIKGFRRKIKYLGNDDLIPMLWAADRISALEEHGVLNPDREDSTEMEHCRSEIIRISKKFNLLSTMTSMIAVEKVTGVKPSKPEIRQVPVMTSRRYSSYGENSRPPAVKEPAAEYGQALPELPEWSVEILKTQTAGGNFAALEIVRRKFPGQIPENTDAENLAVIVTKLALKLLKSHRDTLIIAQLAIAKAGRWLKNKS